MPRKCLLFLPIFEPRNLPIFGFTRVAALVNSGQTGLAWRTPASSWRYSHAPVSWHNSTAVRPPLPTTSYCQVLSCQSHSGWKPTGGQCYFYVRFLHYMQIGLNQQVTTKMTTTIKTLQRETLQREIPLLSKVSGFGDHRRLARV